MSKGRLIALGTLGLLFLDVFVNFSLKIAELAMDVTILAAVIALLWTMHKEEK